MGLDKNNLNTFFRKYMFLDQKTAHPLKQRIYQDEQVATQYLFFVPKLQIPYVMNSVQPQPHQFSALQVPQ